MADLIREVPGGLQVDGLCLLKSCCSCGGRSKPSNYGVGDCCLTYSMVRQENHTVAFFAKATTPNTTNNYEWGYRVKKGLVEVDVLVHDTRGPKDFEFGGKYPPPVSEWQKRGWEILSQFERALEEPPSSCRPEAEARKPETGRGMGRGVPPLSSPQPRQFREGAPKPQVTLTWRPLAGRGASWSK